MAGVQDDLLFPSIWLPVFWMIRVMVNSAHTSESYHSSSARVYLVKGIVKDFQRQVPAPRPVALQPSSQLPTPPTSLLITAGEGTTS